MLAQTNLQLYRQLIEAGWSESQLTTARAAYDLSRELFAGCFRPSHKPFISHLVGTASALAAWGERPELVVAGMLHSSYLYGEFGDTTRGINAEKRRLLRDRVGDAVEQLVTAYTETDHLVLQQVEQDIADGKAPESRDAVVIRLADLCDESLDAGPRYSPAKPLAFGLPANLEARENLLVLADRLIGPLAVADFRSSFEQFDALQPPAVLQNDDRSFHARKRKVEGYRHGKVRGFIERAIKRFGTG